MKPAGDPDPVLQRTAAKAPTLLAPTPGLNFEGLGSGIPGFMVAGAPPDTNGAVGLTQYVQWVNVSFAIFDKTTGAMTLGPVLGKSLWQGFGGSCESDNDGDPIVLYDKLADRWIFSQFAVRTPDVAGGLGPFFQCVAVSTTSDATGTYNRYAFQYSAFDDYPKLGVWPDAYYVTFNMFDPVSDDFTGADACAYDRTAMLAGQAATQVCFQQGKSIGGLLPSDLDGHNPPPSGSPNYMLFYGANVLNLFKFHVDFATPANSTFIGPTVIPVAPFTPLCGDQGTCVPQPATTTLLDSLADRLMFRFAYRNFGDHESLVVNHSVAVGATANSAGGVRWYELRNPNGTPVVAQQSTYAPDTSSFRWMGSIAMDQVGDIALGYSVAGASTFPSIALTARAAGDPASTMGPETIIINGTGSQTTVSSGKPLIRWGDYSAMQVDPSDDCTFWYTTEYLQNTGTFNWNTRIATFKLEGCDKPDLTIAKTHTGNFQQGQNFANYQIAVTNSGPIPTVGLVTVADTLPTGLTFASMFGSGWNCTQTTCTRTDALPAGNTYPVITLTVNAASNAPASVINTAVVSGGGEVNFANDTANDVTMIAPAPVLAVTKTHVGNFTAGQPGAYTITVSNVGGAPTEGAVSMNDFLPSGMTATTISATGWTCSPAPTQFVNCTRSDGLAAGGAYPAITIAVSLDSSVGPNQTNSANVTGGGDLSAHSASDPTTVNVPDLSIAGSHSGNFFVGQVGASYTVNISNVGTVATAGGTVSTNDTLGQGLTATATSGTGWSCNSIFPTTSVLCSRPAGTLAPGASYPPITVTLNVAPDAPPMVLSILDVGGIGDANFNNNIAFDNPVISRVAVTSSGSDSATVTAGNAASFIFSANLATNPPAGTVTFSATGLPPNSKANLTPAFLTQSDPVALTIDTSGNGHVAALQPGGPGRFGHGRLAMFFPFAGVMGFVLLRRTRGKSWLRPALAISFLALWFAFAGCGGGGPPLPPPTPVVTPAGTYTITMAATSTNLTIPPVVTKVTLTVQ